MSLVTPEALEADLEAIARGCPDPAHGVFGPASSVWRVSRELVNFLGAGRAALLQLAHPWVATAVRDHSVTERDLAGRFQRTFFQVFAMTFGDLDAALGAARRIHRIHRGVEGRLDEAAGAFPAGSPYAANVEDALMWVHATLIDTSVRLFERFVAPLGDAGREAHYAETRRFARLFGISDRVLPADWAAFRAYWDAMIASEALAVGATARRQSAQLLAPTRGAARVLWGWHRAVTATLLPERLRDAYGLTLSRREGALVGATFFALERTYRRLPGRARFVPAWFDAQRRLAGRPGRDALGAATERFFIDAMLRGGAV